MVRKLIPGSSAVPSIVCVLPAPARHAARPSAAGGRAPAAWAERRKRRCPRGCAPQGRAARRGQAVRPAAAGSARWRAAGWHVAGARGARARCDGALLRTRPPRARLPGGRAAARPGRARACLAVGKDADVVAVERAGHQRRHVLEHLRLAGAGREGAVEVERLRAPRAGLGALPPAAARPDSNDRAADICTGACSSGARCGMQRWSTSGHAAFSATPRGFLT